jgi:hypothetical protein
MNAAARRIAGSFALAGLALSLNTGCSVVAAVTHPEVAWVDREPARMTVVVRRADAAEAAAQQVNRLLSVPAAEADLGWTASVGPDAVLAAREMRALREEPVYAESRAQVVAAEVWASTLADVGSAGGGQQSLLGAISPKLVGAYADVMAKQHQPSAGARESELMTAVRDAACKVPEAQQLALAPALVNLAKAVDDADVANRAAARAFARARLSMQPSLEDVVRHATADVVREKTRVRPDLAALRMTINASDPAHLHLALEGLRAADLGNVNVVDITDEVTVRAQAWLTHAATLGERLTATSSAIALEREVLHQIRLGWNPNATVEMPQAAYIPDARSREVDAVDAAVRAPRHVSVDSRSASFEGALVPSLPAAPVDSDLRVDSADHPQG